MLIGLGLLRWTCNHMSHIPLHTHTPTCFFFFSFSINAERKTDMSCRPFFLQPFFQCSIFLFSFFVVCPRVVKMPIKVFNINYKKIFWCRLRIFFSGLSWFVVYEHPLHDVPYHISHKTIEIPNRRRNARQS